jgi:hypothetical protein
MGAAVSNILVHIRTALAAAAGLALAGCATVSHGPAPSPAPGAPAASARGLSVDTPIAVIAADPAGKAVLEHDLPGLLERPEYGLFKSMSLKALVPLSNGEITPAKLAEVQRDLQGIPRKAAVER